MSNRMGEIIIHNHSLAPALSEVWVTVVPERVTPTTEVRGRLMGPHCPYASTVEVAYPLRPLPLSRSEQPSATTAASLMRRVVIPEASLWEPESPFLYEGPVELWQDGQCCDRRVVRHGLRTFSLGPSGLRVNGTLLPLRGSVVDQWTEEQMRACRAAGNNLIVGPVVAGAATWWEAADRIGMLVLGQVKSQDEQTARLLAELGRHPSHLGFVLDQRQWDQARQTAVSWLLAHARKGQVGVELDEIPKCSLPQGIQFIVCPQEHTADLAGSGYPLLLMGGASAHLSGSPILGVLSSTKS